MQCNINEVLLEKYLKTMYSHPPLTQIKTEFTTTLSGLDYIIYNAIYSNTFTCLFYCCFRGTAAAILFLRTDKIVSSELKLTKSIIQIF